MLFGIGAKAMRTHNNDLNCNRLNRSPADHLLTRGSAETEHKLD